MKNKKITLFLLPLVLLSCMQNVPVITETNRPDNNSSNKPIVNFPSPSIMPSINYSVSSQPILVTTSSPEPTLSPDAPKNTPSIETIPTPISSPSSFNIRGEVTSILPYKLGPINNEPVYKGPVNIVIDTHLFTEMYNERKLEKVYPRKVYIFKSDYNSSNSEYLSKLKDRFGKFELYNFENYSNLSVKEFMDGDVCCRYGGGVKINSSESSSENDYFYKDVIINSKGIGVTVKNYNDIKEFQKRYLLYATHSIDNIFRCTPIDQQSTLPFMRKLEENIKIINSKGIALGQIKELVFSSFNEASYFALMFDIAVNNTDIVTSAGHYSFNTIIDYDGKMKWAIDDNEENLKRQEELNNNN